MKPAFLHRRHVPERPCPAFSRFCQGTDDQLSVFCFQFDGVFQLALFQKSLRDPNALRISDGDNFGSHRMHHEEVEP